MNRKLTASLLILAAVLANVAFTALGSIFNYPDVLDEPAGAGARRLPRQPGRRQRLVRRPGAVGGAAGAGRDRRRAPLRRTRAMRIAVPVGIAAAVVQVIGLLRWPILVPGYASDAASATRRRGAAATRSRRPATSSAPPSARPSATCSPPRGRCSSIVALGRRYAGRWFQVLGARPRRSSSSACSRRSTCRSIDTANFFGYVLWSVWLIAFAVVIAGPRAPPRAHVRRGDA